MLRIIGRGSYGEVWLARNVMGVLRAVKVVHRDRFDSDRPYEREFSGLQAYEPLSRTCDGLVQVLHVGRRDDAGCFYSVMELADDAASPLGTATGDASAYRPRTLRSDLTRLQRLPIADCLEIGRSLATGLAQLHQHRLVHRDLKPSNVIFVGGRAKLADIGLVAGLGEARSFVGTEGFVPPEGPGRPTADLFALGRLLYHAATGLDPDRFPEIPADWLESTHASELMEFHEIVLRLGEGDVQRRYQSAVEVLADLALMQSGKSLVEFRRLRLRLVWFRRLGLAAAAGLAVAATAWLWSSRQARLERENARLIAAAERRARHELINTSLAQAQAEVRLGRLGGRDAVLRVLTNALVLGPEAAQRRAMRSAAVAAMAQTGTRWIPAPESLRSTDPMSVAGDRDQRLFARRDPDGAVSVVNPDTPDRKSRLPGLRPVDDEVTGFSPDGRFVRLRRGGEFLIGDLSAAAYCHTNGVCVFAPDSRLWVAGADGAVELIELPTGRSVRRLPPAGESRSAPAVTSLAVSPDGSWLATAVGGNQVTLHEVDSGGRGEILQVPGAVYSLTWGSRPGQFAVGLETGELLVWTLPDPHPRWQVPARSGAIRRLAFDPAGRVLATAGEEEVVTLWDAETGQELARVPAIAWQLEFRPSDTRLGLVWRGGEPGFIGLVPSTGFQRVRGPGTGGGDGVLAISSNGKWLAVGTSSSVDVSDAQSGARVASMPAHGVRAIAFGQGGRTLWWLDGGEVCWVPLDQGSPRDPLPRRESGRVWTHLAVSTTTGGLLLADGATDSLVLRSPEGRESRMAPHEFVRFAAIREPGTLIASGSQSVPDVLLWDPVSGRRVARLPSGAQVRPVFSPDGQWLAAAGPACSLWRADDWGPGPTLPAGPANTVAGSAAFSPDSRTLAAVYGDHEIHLFHLPDGAPGLTLEAADGGRLLAVVFSPDGGRLFATTARGEVLCWSLPELESALSQLGLSEMDR